MRKTSRQPNAEHAFREAKVPARQQQSHEIAGYHEAGRLLSNVTTKELQAIIDEEHLEALGIIREKRQVQQLSART